MPVRIPELAVDAESRFPFKCGVGSSTEYDLECGWCGAVYNDGADAKNELGEEVLFINFGHLVVAECCFSKLEGAVLGWAPDIVAWFDWRARRHDQLAAESREMAQRGAEAITKTEG